MKIDVARPYFDDKEEKAVIEVIRSGWVTQGPKVAEFEELFSHYVGAKFAVATTSCTTALHSALKVLGIGQGDEVIIPSLSFIATANAVVHAGATPIFVDVDVNTCNIDVTKIESAITERTKAIMPVHQMGLPADIDSIKNIADKYGLFVIEDAACAIGSEYKGKKIGAHGNIACFSFHPRKVITTGEGGMITTDDDEIAKRLRRLRHHGMSVPDFERHKAQKLIIESYLEIGYNYRMTDIQAAIGIIQLKKLPEILEKRNQIAKNYNDAFSKVNCLRILNVPEYVTYYNYQSYWIELLENAPLTREDFMQKLLQKGISTRRGVMAIHKEPCYSRYIVNLPNTERITSKTVILPLYPSMTEEEVKYVIETVIETLRC